MPNCATALQASLAWCEGTPEYPGIKRRIYYIANSKIVKWPQYDRNANGQIQSATLKGDFELVQGEKWRYIDVLPNECQVTSEAQGDFPSQTQLNKLTIAHASTGEEASNLPSYVNNVSCTFLVQDVKNRYRVIGNEFWDTVSKVSQDLGQGATGNARTTLEAEVTDFIAAPFYTGDVDSEDAQTTTPAAQ